MSKPLKRKSSIFKQETIRSWFTGINESINKEVVQPFQNAEQIMWKYNQAIEHGSLTQSGWERILAQSDDGLKAYLSSIKGTTASMTGYTTSLQGNITGFKKVSAAIQQYNNLSSSGAKEQTVFSTAVGATNGKLGGYLSGLNGAKASIGGYVTSLIGATAKTIGLQVATIALNSAVTLGASLIVSGIVSAISSWVHHTENMISASEEALDTISSLNEKLKTNQKTISDTAKRYADLAQGVNQLSGKNISLNDDDYAEFLDLSNQLAETFPTLSRNYDENGNAIVNLSGNVDTIVGSLNNLIEAERDLINSQIAEQLPTAFDGVQAKSEQYEEELDALKDKRDALSDSLGNIQNDEFTTNFANGLSDKWIKIEGDNLDVISKIRDDYVKILKESSLDFEELTPDYEIKDGVEVPVGFTLKVDASDEDIENAKSVIDGKVEALAQQYETDIENLNDKILTTTNKNKANWASLAGSITSWLSTDSSYKVMSDDMQSAIQQIVNNLDWSSLDFDSWEDAQQYIQDNIMTLFEGSDKEENIKKIEVMFGIQTQFNNGDISVDQYQQKLKEFLSSISSLPAETQKSLKMLFGIETDENGVNSSNVDTLVNNVKGKLKDSFDEKVGELSLEDLDIASKLEISDGVPLTWDELIAKIQEYKDNLENANETSLSFNYSNLDGLESKLSSIQSAYNTATDAIKQYNEQGYLNMDTIDSLLSLSDSYINALFDENGQLQSSEATFQELARIKIEEAKASVYQEACNELVRIKQLDTALAAQELSLANGTLTQSAYDTAQALYEEISAMGGANAKLAGNVWDAANKKVKVLDNQLKNVTKSSYSFKKAYASSGSKSSTDAIKEAFDAEYKALQHAHNMELISDEQYYSSVSALNDKYYKGNTEHLDDYQKYQEEVYKGMQSVYKEYVESNTDLLKAQLDAGKISYQYYSSKVGSMLKDMYESGKISAEDYFKYVEDKIDNQLSIYEKALKAVTKRLEDEAQVWEDKIEALEDENDKLEEQKDLYDSVLSAVNKVYDDQIEQANNQKDAIQDVIDAMQDENDEQERAIALQKAKYNLAKSQSQNSNLIYQNGQFVYTNDMSAIRDAQAELKDAQFNIDIAELRKQQDALDDYIDTLNSFKNMWSDVAEAYQTEQDAMNASAVLGSNYAEKVLSNNVQDINNFKNQYVEIQAQIDDNTSLINSYQEKVDYYNDLKDQWASVSEVYENEMNAQYATMLLGQNWEAEVLAGRQDTLQKFTNEYIALQQAQADAAANAANAIVQANKNAAASAMTANTPVSPSGGSGSSGTSSSSTSPSVGATIGTTNAHPNKYWIYKTLGSFSTNGEASSRRGMLNGDDVINVDGKYLVVKWEKGYATTGQASSNIANYSGNGVYKRYKKGGMLDNNSSSSYLDSIARSMGEDHIGTVAFEEGERILTPAQNTSWEMWTKAMPDLMSYMQPLKDFSAPDYSNLVTRSVSNNTQIESSITFNCPNVTDKAVCDYVMTELENEFNKLGAKAQQRYSKVGK